MVYHYGSPLRFNITVHHYGSSSVRAVSVRVECSNVSLMLLLLSLRGQPIGVVSTKQSAQKRRPKVSSLWSRRITERARGVISALDSLIAVGLITSFASFASYHPPHTHTPFIVRLSHYSLCCHFATIWVLVGKDSLEVGKKILARYTGVPHWSVVQESLQQSVSQESLHQNV